MSKRNNDLQLKVFFIAMSLWWTLIISIGFVLIFIQSIFIFDKLGIAILFWLVTILLFNYGLKSIYKNRNKKWVHTFLFIFAIFHFIPLLLQLIGLSAPGPDNIVTAIIGFWIVYIIRKN